MSIVETVIDHLYKVRETNPLVHHITNYVTVTDCANITLALGGSPIMADDIDEVEEMEAFASSLVLNIGTLNARTIEAMVAAGKAANKRGIPVVLDPVGVGATRLRTETASRIIEQVRPAVIRGNMSEIKLIAGLDVAIKGVDSTADEQDALHVAEQLAKRLNCIIAITGKRDVISDGERTYLADNGHEMLARVTGTGCMTTSLVATCCGAGGDRLSAALAGIVFMGIAGEMARQSLAATDGIGVFRTRIFDGIYNLTDEIVRQKARIIG